MVTINERSHNFTTVCFKKDLFVKCAPSLLQSRLVLRRVTIDFVCAAVSDRCAPIALGPGTTGTS